MAFLDSLVRFRPFARALRPSQWTKNFVVLAPLFFAFWDIRQQLSLGAGLARVIPAALLFCLVSSGVYLINDIRDMPQDRKHPLKKSRPIAAGQVPVPAAWCMAAVLLIGGLAASCLLLSRGFAAVLASYVGLQLIYSLGLKRVPLVDILVIAGGFVLRAIAGAVAVAIEISPWLLLCTFLLALFLALCKRRHEKILLSDAAADHRASLEHYDERVMDQLIAVCASATIVSYAIYTLWPDTVEKFGTHALGFTVPFVIFGIFRYIDLAYRHDKGGRPERILLTDIPLIVNLLLYGASALLIFLLANLRAAGG